MKKKFASLMLIPIFSMSLLTTNAYASVRYVKAVNYSFWGPGAEEYTTHLFLTAKEADKVADSWRPSAQSAWIATGLGLLPKAGPGIAIQYMGWSDECGRVADKIDNAADDVPNGKLLKVEISCLYISGYKNPVRVKTSIVDKYSNKISKPSPNYKIDAVDYKYIDDGGC